ncbi:MAG: hypothetical protein E7617_07905 [Ruminococcaceae bacterium]|nr:hypothetical protein [Oscillospiraceae bacterium]
MADNSKPNSGVNPDATPFEMWEKISKTHLDFEGIEDAEAYVEPDDTAEINELEISSEDVSHAKSADAVKVPESTETVASEDEFDIPDVFAIADGIEARSNMTGSGLDDYVPTIWTPYMPKFTDVTAPKYLTVEDVERSHQQAVNEQKQESVPESADKGPHQIRVEQRAPEDRTFGFSDPTAEVISAVPEAVVVNVKGAGGEKSSTINVFKFPEESTDTAVTEEISDEELQKREITELTGHVWRDNDSDPEHTAGISGGGFISSPSKEETKVAQPIISDDCLTMENHFEYEKAPTEIEYEPTEVKSDDAMRKPRFGRARAEYTSHASRDQFKDKFLDSIMAVRIRFAVAAFLALLSMLFDIFERNICTYFGFEGNPSAPAIIDMCFIISLFLISIPETVRAIRQLIRGIYSPELSGLLAGVTIFTYTVTMASVAPSGGVYPLFASVYSIMVVNSIFAINCLHSANFRAFRIISERGKKRIVEKPLTRTLEGENHALDGVVDEYKSKTAMVFDVAFVSGFSENTSGNKEKTKNNLLALALSYGIALVCALAMYFLFGFVQALAAFALIIALSTPAFAILSHKLPYSAITRATFKRGSTVVGERSLYEFTPVDAVAFEDTEVFGPDDVKLKSVSVKRSDYMDTMKKMASLFAATGGPLSLVFETAVNKKYPPAEDVLIEDDGVSGMVDGKKVMAGNAEYMRRNDIKIPVGGNAEYAGTKIIYAASDGEFIATFTVNYAFSEEFAYMLAAMREEKMTPLIYTRDFNVTVEFMRVLTGGADVVRVLRRHTEYNEPKLYQRVNANMVTGGDKASVLDLLFMARKYSRFQALMSIIEISACVSGAALAVAIALSNMTFALPPVILAVWQIGWSAVLAVMSRKTFNPSIKEPDYADE